MKTDITFNAREINTLKNTIEILEEYSTIYSASVRNKTGAFPDAAATAAGLIKTLIKIHNEEV